MKSVIVAALVIAGWSWQGLAAQTDGDDSSKPTAQAAPAKAPTAATKKKSSTPAAKAPDVIPPPVHRGDPANNTQPVKTVAAPSEPSAKPAAPAVVAPAAKPAPVVSRPAVAQPKVAAKVPTHAPTPTKPKKVAPHSTTARRLNPTAVPPKASIPPPVKKIAAQKPAAPASKPVVVTPAKAPAAPLDLAHSAPVHAFQGPDAGKLASIHENNEAELLKNPRALDFVDRNMKQYQAKYQNQLVERQQRYQLPTLMNSWRADYKPWAPQEFYAYGWEVRPVVEFYSYFSNPCVAWFYLDYDSNFYQPVYGSYVQRYPDLGRGYNHIGIYFPTEEFIGLNESISELPIAIQVNYRRAMMYLGDRLSERSVRPIGRHEVVINHYQMLPSGREVLIEGFADSSDSTLPFEALIDLNYADNSLLFSVGNWKSNRQPTPEQMEDLNEINDHFSDLGLQVDIPPGI